MRLTARMFSLALTFCVLNAVTLLAATEVQAAPAAYGLEERFVDEVPTIFAQYGQDVAVTETRMAISSSEPKSVDLYLRTGANWTLDRTIVLTDSSSSMDMDGDTLVVGHYGSVDVYDLLTPNAAPTHLADPISNFGQAVAIDGDQLIVGSDGPVDGRKVMVYERSGPDWILAPGGELRPGVPTTGLFGRTVDIDGDLAVVPDGDNVFVYRHLAAGWSFEERIPSPTGDQIDIESGAQVVAGVIAIGVDEPSGTDSGTVSLLGRTGATWSTTASLVVPGDLEEMALGDGQLAVLDAVGTVHGYASEAGTWLAGPAFPLPVAGDEWTTFASPKIDIWGDLAVVGSPGARANNIYEAGAVYALGRGAIPGNPPSAPIDVIATATPAPGSASLTWQPPIDDGGRSVLRYIIDATAVGNGSTSTQLVVPGDSTSSEISGLTEFGTYTFTVTAENAMGRGGPSSPTTSLMVNGPDLVPSPHTVYDEIGDNPDPRTDITDLTIDYTGEFITLSLRMSQPVDPLTDPLFLGSGLGSWIYLRPAPPALAYGMIMQHESTNASPYSLPGEDMIARFEFDDSCGRPVFPVRVVDGAYQTTFPASCVGTPFAVRWSATILGPNIDQDSISLSPPVERAIPEILGSLSVGISVSGPGAGSQDTAEYTIDCDNGFSSTITIPQQTIQGVSTKQFDGLPAGTTCVIATRTDGANSAVTANTTVTPSQVTIPPDSTVSSAISVVYAPRPAGALALTINVSGTGVGSQDAAEFALACDDGFSGSVTIPPQTPTGSSTRLINGFLTPTSCAITTRTSGANSTVTADTTIIPGQVAITPGLTAHADISVAYTQLPMLSDTGPDTAIDQLFSAGVGMLLTGALLLVIVEINERRRHRI